MSRYLILFVVNLPFVIAGLVSALAAYKMGRQSKKKFFFQVVLWLTVLAGLALAEPIYEFLFSNNLTATEPLSLFDVIQLTSIIFLLFAANRSRMKLEVMERRVQDLHQELSIRLSESSGGIRS